MLADNCHTLLDLLKQLEKARENKRIVDSLAERKSDLEQVRTEVDAAAAMLTTIKEREEPTAIPDGSKALQYVNAMREALEQDPESITKGRGFTNLKRAFSKLSDEMADVSEETWKLYVNKVEPKADVNQVAQARQLQEYRSDAERLQVLVDTAKRLGRKPPRDKEACGVLELHWQAIRELIDKLPAPTDNPEIQDFLKAANSREGAAIELLTEEVLRWLNENAMADKFRVRHA